MKAEWVVRYDVVLRATSWIQNVQTQEQHLSRPTCKASSLVVIVLILRMSHDLLPQDLLHRLTLGEFVDEFVHVADLLHQGVLDVLDADAADDAFDQGSLGIHGGGVGEEGLEVDLVLDLLLEAGGVIAGQPTDDLVDLGLGALLALGLLDVERVDLREGDGEHALVVHGGSCRMVETLERWGGRTMGERVNARRPRALTP